jgi:hypothetical protein
LCQGRAFDFGGDGAGKGLKRIAAAIGETLRGGKPKRLAAAWGEDDLEKVRFDVIYAMVRSSCNRWISATWSWTASGGRDTGPARRTATALAAVRTSRGPLAHHDGLGGMARLADFKERALGRLAGVGGDPGSLAAILMAHLRDVRASLAELKHRDDQGRASS